MRIQHVYARQILDSRGNPTIEVDLVTNSSIGTASVPSGASTGRYEAKELRDGGISYNGKNVLQAIRLVNEEIAGVLKGKTVDEHRTIDEIMQKLDGTSDKSRLGANSILGVSMAATRAGALSHKIHLFEYLSALYDNTKNNLPVPFANIINGGEHTGNKLKFQEFMIAPIKAKSFHEATRAIAEIYEELKTLLEQEHGSSSTAVGDEGGFSPDISTPEEALELINKAIWGAGYKGKIGIAIDAAASEFYNEEGKYEAIEGKQYTNQELIKYYGQLINKYNIISIEDPFDQEDYESWKEFTSKYGSKIQVVGDDLTVTNPERIRNAINEKLCNTLLLKVNQIGTVTEAMEAAHEAEKANWKIMVSHRSGETEDSYIADLAVGINAGQIKLGAPARGERTSKYNQLLRIEGFLGRNAGYSRM